jgi:uncharacterized membrane protein
MDMRRLKTAVLRHTRPLSATGLFVGTLFFAFSLAPSLLPRPFLFQSVVSGFSLTLGYALGSAGRWLWSYLELPVPGGRAKHVVAAIAAVVGIAAVAAFVWWASEWQNSVRRLMELPDVGGVRPAGVTIIALLVFGGFLSLARRFRRTFRFFSQRIDRFFPRRVSNLVAVIAAVVVFWALIDGVLFSVILRVADGISRQVDATIPADLAPPEDPLRTGSAQSLIAWQDIGHQGRLFVSSGPTAEQLSAFHRRALPAPIRVYVGLHAAETPEARARLALQEFDRVGGFERSVVLLVTPTGTGWVDPAALDTVEYLHRGDIASVAAQYSYLPSVLALPTESAYGAENARAFFREFYGRWTGLPRATRPALYLYGVSLGALNSERAFDAYDIIGDPSQGALWTGPPFRSETWNSITAERQPDSPAWLPRFRDGSVVRVMNQHGGLEVGDAEWGPVRFAYLQYASDPITFFSLRSFYREPEWMRPPRGPDVSPALRWFPGVTMVQLAADMTVANSPPPGYGHNFAAEHYIDAWLALMEPDGWTADDVSRLKALYARQR